MTTEPASPSGPDPRPSGPAGARPALTRRELLAWLAAVTGAATTAGVVLAGERGGSGSAPGGRSRTGPTSPSASRSGSMVDEGHRESADPVGAARPGDPLLVVVELSGGNDGWSTAVPVGIGRYHDLRSETVVADDEVLMIDDVTGLHPALSGLHTRGVSVVQGVGSPEPDGSHFEMLARWWAGAPTRRAMREHEATGWLGRLADVLDDGRAPAPIISVGSGAAPVLRSRAASTLALRSVDDLRSLVGAEPDDRHRSAYQHALRGLASGDDAGALGALRRSFTQTFDFADRVVGDGASTTGSGDTDGAADGYPSTGLGESLGFAATVLAADAGVRVVHVRMDGDFDTHDGHPWRHAELMADLDASLVAFHDDVARRGLADRMLVMTTSEFGRTLRENGSSGLDHGTASSMLLSGAPVGGSNSCVGERPSLSRLDDEGEPVATLPFDAYLAGVVEHWLDVPADEVFGTGVDPAPLFG